ncbi:hypothetical protein MMC07_008437 [Pseudocyphellaria aurata]|nr:hypothetical protein [Pseudocyphellaria aurata]
MTTAPFCLTFGVELEFLVRYDPEDYRYESRRPERSLNLLEIHSLVRKRMIHILNDNGFSTHPYFYTSVSEWTVSFDGTIRADGCENCRAIELKSPALEYSPFGLKQVTEVVELLGFEFDLFVNQSCGLHVHVGNETRGFSMETLKTFASLITVFEKQLNSLHPPDRLQNQYAKPLRSAFLKDALPRDKLLIIDDLEDMTDLIWRFHPVRDDGHRDKYMAFNFWNLRKDQAFQTIEFRQHRGTVDPNEIANWVRVVCSLVRMSHADGEGVRDLIEKRLDSPDYTALDLFVDLNLSDLATFYAPLVARYGNEDPSPDRAGVDQSSAFQPATR